MKKLVVVLLVFLGVPVLLAQSSSLNDSPNSWQDVKVVYDSSEVAEMEKGEMLSKTINTSLNFGTKEKFRENCLEELKKEAAQKGYSVILISEKDSKEKRFNKRGFEVTMVGTGYKS